MTSFTIGQLAFSVEFDFTCRAAHRIFFSSITKHTFLEMLFLPVESEDNAFETRYIISSTTELTYTSYIILDLSHTGSTA